MDSPVVTQLFRQLLTRPARNCLHSRHSRNGLIKPQSNQKRGYALRKTEHELGQSSDWQQRIDAFPKNKFPQLREYPRVTSFDLRHRMQRPRRVKMLARDFIEDSLYNPNYGYFSKHATIYESPRPFDFNNIADEADFNRLVNESYFEFEDALDEVEPNENRQLWHTPTELFRPHYGEAIARYLVTNYKMTLYPYHDLIIYEIGAGNGTMMRNIMDYIRETDEDVYRRTQYRVVEISSLLAEYQMENLRRSPYYKDHAHHVEIINSSVFDWNQYVNSPCFFLALEVIDNLSHDCIRYDPVTEQPLQGIVLIDEEGEFFEFYEKKLDPIAERYLHIRDIAARSDYETPVSGSKWLRKIKHGLPFAPNMTAPEYIPTRLMQFFDMLKEYFPAHRLILSDFTSLPTPVPGINAPIVQTRYQRRNVMVTTPYVHQGYFDIFFPTNFNLMEDMYRVITGKLTRVSSHRDFMQNWAYVEDTQMRSGESPMLTWYKNASMMTTV